MEHQSSRSRGAAERATCIVKRRLHEVHVTARASCAVGRPRTAQRDRCAPARMALSRCQFSGQFWFIRRHSDCCSAERNPSLDVKVYK
eukprot:1828237-Amphidinium_carterae.1